MASENKHFHVVNWGILGSGHISHAFCLSLTRLNSPRHRFVAVASRSSISKAEEFAKKFKIGRFYGSYEELLADPEINAIYVGNLTPAHYEATMAGIAAGKAVLVEKPMTMTYEESKNIVEASRSNGILVMEALWSRFTLPYERLRQLVKNGHQPDSMIACYSVPFQHVDRLLRPEIGGGVLRDIGLYAISLATMLWGGSAPEEIQSTGVRNEYGVDIADTVALKYAGGGCVSILVDSRCGSRNLSDARIFFEPGAEFASVRLCPPFYVTSKLELTKADGTVVVEDYPIYPDLPPPPEGLTFRNAASQALAYEAEAFADIFQVWMATRGSPKVVIEHPLRTHEETLIDAKTIETATAWVKNKP